MPVRPLTTKRIDVDSTSKKLCCVLDQTRSGRPSSRRPGSCDRPIQFWNCSIRCRRPALSSSALPAPPAAPGLPSNVVTPASQVVEHVRVGLQPGRRPPFAGSRACRMIDDHHRVLAREREAADCSAGGRRSGIPATIAGARVGVDGGAAVIRAEGGVAAGQVAHLEHRCSSGAAPSRGTRSACCCRIARSTSASMPCSLLLDQLEVAQAELVLLDHVEHVAVAVVARLDAVDLVVQLAGEFLDVGEIVQPLVVECRWARRGCICAPVRLARDDLDRMVVDERLAVGRPSTASSCPGRRRCPCSSSTVGDRHRQQRDLAAGSRGP